MCIWVALHMHVNKRTCTTIEHLSVFRTPHASLSRADRQTDRQTYWYKRHVAENCRGGLSRSYQYRTYMSHPKFSSDREIKFWYKRLVTFFLSVLVALHLPNLSNSLSIEHFALRRWSAGARNNNGGKGPESRLGRSCISGNDIMPMSFPRIVSNMITLADKFCRQKK